MLQLVDVIGVVTGRTPIVTALPEVTDDTSRLVADISKLRGLGFDPTMTLADGVSDLVSQLGTNPELPTGATSSGAANNPSNCDEKIVAAQGPEAPSRGTLE